MTDDEVSEAARRYCTGDSLAKVALAFNVDAATLRRELLREAMRTHLSDDCRWEQAGLPTTIGGDEAAQLVGAMETMGFSNMAVEFRNVAVVGDVVFTERVDWLVRPDGSRLGPWPVVGVTEFRDGKISAWREYFDSRNLEMLPSS